MCKSFKEKNIIYCYITMDTASNNSSSNNSGFCKYCDIELNQSNTSKVGRKSCRQCNLDRLDKVKADKTPQPNKIC